MSFRVLTVPTAGLRVNTDSPADTYRVITDLLETGYTLDDMEWEDAPHHEG